MGKSRSRKWFDKGDDYDTKDRRDFDSRRNAKKRKQHNREIFDEDTDELEYANNQAGRSYRKHR